MADPTDAGPAPRQSNSLSSAVTILALIASLLYFSPPASGNRLKPLSSLPTDGTVQSDFKADFSGASERGIGFRYHHLPSGRFVDLRLKGYPPATPRVEGNRVEFQASKGVKVVYEAYPRMVKETIVLDQRSPSEFRFQLKTKGLEPSVVGGDIYFGSPLYPNMLRLEPVEAWDAEGKEIPGSLELDRARSEVVLQLDKEALASARPPVFIDPQIMIYMDGMDGGGGGGGSSSSSPAPPTGTFARTLLQTSDGVLLYFFRMSVTGGSQIAYVISSDQGTTWSNPPTTVGDVGLYSDLAVAKDQNDNFLLTYTNETTQSVWVGFRELRRDSGATSWTAGEERQVYNGSVTLKPAPSVVDLGFKDPQNRKVAVGYGRLNELGQYEYVTSFSEDSGKSWSILPFTCATGTHLGTLISQGSRLLCITVPGLPYALQWREWNGVSWGLANYMTIVSGYAPSMALDSDGTLHLAASESGIVYHTSLTPGASDWSAKVTVGKGSYPVISSTGSSLYVYADEYFTTRENRILPYVSSDGGKTWNPGEPLGGRVLSQVLDYNAAWAFTDLQKGDALFAITDGSGTFGNRIGIANFLHRIDSRDKKVALGFVPGSDGLVSKISLWGYDSAYSATESFRIGIQSDCSAFDSSCSGLPSDRWVDEVWVAGVLVSGSFDDTDDLVTTIPETALAAGTRYHVVVEAAPATPLRKDPSIYNYLEVQTVEVDAGAEGSYLVLDMAGGVWSKAPARVPRFTLSGSVGAVASQEIAYQYDLRQHVGNYSIPGEFFVAPRDSAPTEIKVYLRQDGTKGVTFRLLDASGSEIWSSYSSSPQSGWVSVPVSGVQLVAGNRYRLVLDGAPDSGGLYLEGSSGYLWTANPVSWDGSNSSFTKAYDRKGFNDRSKEASDFSCGYYCDDFIVFNGSSSDLLYLGDSNPFDFAQLTKGAYGNSANTGTSWSYWNGSSWADLSMGQNKLGEGGDSDFVPPNDWKQTTVDGKTAYWVKVASTSSGPTPIHVYRLTGIKNFQRPRAAPKGSGFVPLAWARYISPQGIEFTPYDALPPSILPQSITPPDFGNTIFTSQPVSVKVADPPSGSGVDPLSITFSVIDETDGSVREVSGTTYNPINWWASTSSIDWQPDHIYRIEVSAADFAGNASSIAHSPKEFGGGTAIVQLKLDSAVARIPKTECAISIEVDLNDQKEVTCNNVLLNLDSSSLSLSASRHGFGTGFVLHHVPLASALIIGTAGGSTSAQPAFPPGTIQTVPVRFDVEQHTNIPQAIATAGKTANLGTVTSKVPSTWTTASIEMSDTISSPTTAACSNPTLALSQIPCSPDPLSDRYIVVARPGLSDIDALAAEHAIAHGAEIDSVYPDVNWYSAAVPFSSMSSILADTRVLTAFRDSLADAVHWSGSSCASGFVNVRMFFPPVDGYEQTAKIGTGESPACEQYVLEDFQKVPCAMSTDLCPGIPPAPEQCEPQSAFNNYVHTEYEIQGVLNDPLAWLKSTGLRYWNRCEAWWDRHHDPYQVFTWAGTNSDFPWWHHLRPRMHVIWGPTDSRVFSVSQGKYYTDVPWCNDTGERISLNILVHTYNDGSRTVDFSGIGHCEGTHRKTSSTTNQERWPGPYGGQNVSEIVYPVYPATSSI